MQTAPLGALQTIRQTLQENIGKRLSLGKSSALVAGEPCQQLRVWLDELGCFESESPNVSF